MQSAMEWGNNLVRVWPSILMFGLVDYVSGEMIQGPAMRAAGKIGFYATSGLNMAIKMMVWGQQ